MKSDVENFRVQWGGDDGRIKIILHLENKVHLQVAISRKTALELVDELTKALNAVKKKTSIH